MKSRFQKRQEKEWQSAMLMLCSQAVQFGRLTVQLAHTSKSASQAIDDVLKYVAKSKKYSENPKRCHQETSRPANVAIIAPMSDDEFEQLMERLFRWSADNGDIGHAYWTRVIQQLRAMRALSATCK